MSLTACLARLKSEGVIDAERAARYEAEFDRLNRAYAKSMGAAAALDAASRDTMDALEFQALTQRRQTMLQIQSQKTILGDLQAFVEKGGKAGHFATAVMESRDAAFGVAGVENVRGALFKLAWTRMDGFLKRYGHDMLGRVRRGDEVREMVRALRGETTDNAMARQMAAAVGDTLEWLRVQFNAAGGAIPKLKDWGLPQSHDALAVAQAGLDDWRAFIRPLLDPAKMIDNTTGKAFASDEAVEEALEAAWRNISSEGMDGAVPGAFNGGGKMANRRADHRFFVFRDADAWLAYNDRFGTGDPFNSIVGHIDSMTRDIAAMRVLGPNPAHTIGWLQDVLNQQALPGRAGGKAARLDTKAKKGARTMERMWRYYAGELTAVAPENRATARFFMGLRNWNVMSKLGKAFLSAVPTDPVFKAFTARFNDLPVTRALGDYIGTFNPLDPSHRAAAEAAGMVFSEMTQRAQRIYREGQGVNVVELTRRGADGLMRTTLLSPHTVAAKQSFGLSWMRDWAENAHTPFARLSEGKRLALERYGIGEADWDRLRAVPVDDTGGVKLLRPGDLARLSDGGDRAALDSAIKFFSLIDAEGRYDTPGELLRAQATLALGGRGAALERGTVLGEMAHSATQFKTYPVIWMMTHLERSLYGRGAISRAQYGVLLPIFLTLGGMIAYSMRQIFEGYDPPNWLDPKTMAFGFAVGGGGGIIADIASQGIAGQRGTTGTLSGFVTGPTLGSVVDPTISLTLGNLGQAGRGEKTNFGRELYRFGRKNLPGSNVWYAQAALNRMMLDEMQRMIDPDFDKSAARLQRQAAQRGSDYWYAPGNFWPDRAPAFDTITGDAP